MEQTKASRVSSNKAVYQRRQAYRVSKFCRTVRSLPPKVNHKKAEE